MAISSFPTFTFFLLRPLLQKILFKHFFWGLILPTQHYSANVLCMFPQGAIRQMDGTQRSLLQYLQHYGYYWEDKGNSVKYFQVGNLIGENTKPYTADRNQTLFLFISSFILLKVLNTTDQILDLSSTS